MGVRAKHVFRWDLDKTYLRTEFDTAKDLLRTFMEPAENKRAYPGVTALLRSLRQSSDYRICIVSGSPSQMRKVLTAKLALDGIEFDEFVLKNNLHNLLKLRFRALRSQVPFKLPALLESRVGIIGDAKETLFGDDSETDGVVYSLYGDILAGKVGPDELKASLIAANAYPDQVDRTMALADHVRGSGDYVQRIIIHLDKQSPPSRFAHFGHRLVPVHDYLQAALIMYQDELIDCGQMLFVIDDMLSSGEFDFQSLSESVHDLLRRGRFAEQSGERLVADLETAAKGASSEDRAERINRIARFAKQVAQEDDSDYQEWPDANPSPSLDYPALLKTESGRKRSEAR